MDVLNDDNLERLGVIKEIDTLNIVIKAAEIKEKKKRKILSISLSIIMVISMIAQLVFFKVFGVNTIQLIAMCIYVVVLSLLLGVFCIKGGEIV